MEHASTEDFDCIVIGGGQGASLADDLANAGRKTAVIERDDMGGTCVNRGCTPTKTLIASARVANYARHAGRWGVHTGEVHVDMGEVADRKDAIVSEFRGDAEKSVQISNLELLRGEATFVAPRTVQVLGSGRTRVLRGEVIVIATGGENVVPPVEGLDRTMKLTRARKEVRNERTVGRAALC